MTLILLLHARADVVPAYEAAWPGAKVAFVKLDGSAPAYAALAKETPSILELADELADDWSHPLIVCAFSAGGWALRSYLEHEENRDVIDVAVFLDATYGAPGGKCDIAPYQGVIAFGQRRMLALTSSNANPEPYACSLAIQALAPNAVVVHEATTHDEQLTEVGPEAIRGLADGFKGVRRFKLMMGAVVIGIAGYFSWRVLR
jgi:hypothetical protein